MPTTDDKKTGTSTENNTENKNDQKQKPQSLVKGFMSKLKQKKFWLPLLIAHLIMFAAMGGYAFYKAQYAKSIDYTLANLNKALELNDIELLSDIFDSDRLMFSAYQEAEALANRSPNLRRYVGIFPSFEQFSFGFSKILLNLMQNTQEQYEFNKTLELIPTDFNEQIRAQYFKINEKLSKPERKYYVLECNIRTLKWGNFPLQLTANFDGEHWVIDKIYNFVNILDIYNTEIISIQKEKDEYRKEQRLALLSTISSYVPAPKCSAYITDSSGKALLTINFAAGANSNKEDIVDFGSEIYVTLKNNTAVYQGVLDVDRLFRPGDQVTNTWNIALPEAHAEWLLTEKLICNAIVTHVTLSNGEHYEIVLH